MANSGRGTGSHSFVENIPCWGNPSCTYAPNPADCLSAWYAGGDIKNWGDHSCMWFSCPCNEFSGEGENRESACEGASTWCIWDDETKECSIDPDVCSSQNNLDDCDDIVGCSWDLVSIPNICVPGFAGEMSGGTGTDCSVYSFDTCFGDCAWDWDTNTCAASTPAGDTGGDTTGGTGTTDCAMYFSDIECVAPCVWDWMMMMCN